MRITLPIAGFAAQLIEWLRTESVRLGMLTLSLPRPRIAVDNGAVVLRFGGFVEVGVDDGPLATLLRTGTLRRVAPGTDLVVPDLLGFTVEDVASGGVSWTWPAPVRPRLDTPLPTFLDPVVLSVLLWPDRGRAVVRRGPDVEIAYTPAAWMPVSPSAGVRTDRR